MSRATATNLTMPLFEHYDYALFAYDFYNIKPKVSG
jgi:hypothetical protein